MVQNEFNFSGTTYAAEFDYERLNRQLRAVYDLMRDGVWRTLGEISLATGSPQASCSARLRDFRKKQFGSLVVERRSRGDRDRGLYEYRLKVGAE